MQADIYKTLYNNGYAGVFGWVYYNAQNDPSYDKGVFMSNMRTVAAAYGTKGWPTTPAASATATATTTATAAKACTNNYPYNDGYTCAQQASWGKCGAAFMKAPCVTSPVAAAEKHSSTHTNDD